MTLRVTIELAGPPRGKGRGRAFVHNQTGRFTVATPAKTRTYESQLRYAAQQEMAGRQPTMQPVRVHVEAVLPIAGSWPKKKLAAARLGHIHPVGRGSGDLDNYLKILDALNGIVWVDDCQVIEAHVRKLYGEAPTLTVRVETIEPPALPAVREARLHAPDRVAEELLL